MLKTLLVAFITTTIACAGFTQPSLQPDDRIAVQLYVFGEPARAPGEKLAGVLETVRECGYTQVQAWLSYFESEESTHKLKTLLDRYELSMPAAYTGAKLHVREGVEKVIEEILRKAERGAAAGLKVVVVNPSPIDGEKSDEQLGIQAENLNRLGGLLSERGLILAIHQHAPEMASRAREWRHILRKTDPDKVFFCLDTHWVLRGGEDPYELTREAGNRLVDVHLRNSRDGTWTQALGEGDIDYEKIAGILDEIDYKGYLTVELAHEKGTDVTRPLSDNLKKSLEFVRRVFNP